MAAALWIALVLLIDRPGREAEKASAAVPVARLQVGVPLVPHDEPALAPQDPNSRAGHGPDEVQMCGGGWVRINPDGSPDDEDLRRATQWPETRAHILDNLRADPNELARAAALWLAAPGPDGRDALARMAVSSTNPHVYALAFQVCGGNRPAEGACQLLSVEQWARVDPGNATPWMFALNAARQRKDRAAQDEALHRIATAQRSESDFFTIPGLIISHAPTGDALMTATFGLAVEAIGMRAAWAIPGYQDVTNACKGDALRDANRRQTCNAVAELWVERSDTLIERSIGVSMGQRLDWPAERVDRLRGEFVAHTASQGKALDEMERAGECASTRHALDRLTHHAVVGEAGALREWVAQSGQSPDDFIRAERAGRAAFAALAASASTAATGASAAHP